MAGTQWVPEVSKRAGRYGLVISKHAVDYLLGQLERLDYLTRRADESDQRSTRIHLTPRGHATIKAMRNIVLEVEAESQAQLGSREFAKLRDLLAQLQTMAARANYPNP